jgi:ATP-dependent exoDNAse (exonuclease V) beta subunit
VSKIELESARLRVKNALCSALADERGRWILSEQHQDARSEYALSTVQAQRLVNIRIDRTFIDADGVRWIIDYKTGAHTGSDVDGFLDQEQERYRGQMERYAAVFRQMEEHPIRLGLYFPLLSGWRSWEL